MEKYEYERAKYRRENVSKYSNSMRQKCERLPKMYFKLTFHAKKNYSNVVGHKTYRKIIFKMITECNRMEK